MHARRKDGNHDECRDAAQAAGWRVVETYKHPGMLDIIVSKHGVITVWVEIKLPGKKWTPAERELMTTWRGEMITVYGAQDTVTQLALIEQKFAPLLQALRRELPF